MKRLGPVLAIAILAASGCGDDRAPRVPHTMVVSPARATAAEIDETVPFRAQVLDADGAIIYEADIHWTSSDERVATVSQRGVATVTGQGSAEIRATHARVSATGLLDVRFTPARLVKVAGDAQSAPALSRVPEDPAVRVEDRAGVPIPGVDVIFDVVSGEGSVDPRRVATDTSGVASARWTLGWTQGEQRLRSRADTFAVEFAAVATEPELAIVTQALRRARATVSYRVPIEIVGTREEPLVWSVTRGRLPFGVRLDSAGVLTGAPLVAGTDSFTVSVGDAAGRRSTKDLTLLVCPRPLRMRPGDILVLTQDQLTPCPPALPTGGAGDLYRIATLRTGMSPLGTPATTLKVTEIGVASASPGSMRRASGTADATATTGASALPPGLAAGVRIAEATARFHAKLHEDARRLTRGLGRSALLPDTRTGPPAASPAPTRQTTPPRRIELRPYAGSGGCNRPGPAPVPALLAAYNDHLAIYQDSVQRSTQPVRAQDARQVLDYYAAFGAETIDEYFGGVPDIDGDGRVTVFVSPAVGGDVAGFVWPGDFLSRDACAGSNERELVYVNEQLFRALGIEQESRHYQALSTVVHEVKHVSSLYRRTVVDSYHPTWIEEGTAEIAAERSSRKAMEAVGGVAQEALLTRDDYPPRDGVIISPANYGTLVALARTTLAYTAHTNSLVYDPSPEHTFYGSAWHFHRFLGDAYGNAAQRSDGDFFTTLNDTITPAGTEGIEEVTGRPISELIVEYAAAMMLGGTNAPQPERIFRTYDFPSATFQLFRPGFQPAGLYPWPRTGPEPAPFRSGVWVGALAPASVRFYDFRSEGSGPSIEIEVLTGNLPDLRIVLSRLR